MLYLMLSSTVRYCLTTRAVLQPLCNDTSTKSTALLDAHLCYAFQRFWLPGVGWRRGIRNRCKSMSPLEDGFEVQLNEDLLRRISTHASLAVCGRIRSSGQQIRVSWEYWDVLALSAQWHNSTFYLKHKYFMSPVIKIYHRRLQLMGVPIKST